MQSNLSTLTGGEEAIKYMRTYGCEKMFSRANLPILKNPDIEQSCSKYGFDYFRGVERPLVKRNDII